MTVTGKLLIAGQWQEGQQDSFYSVNPATGNNNTVAHQQASTKQIEQAAIAAQHAFQQYRHSSFSQRCAFLHSCADEIMALGDELLNVMQQESGYPVSRCQSERKRTVDQLHMYADFVAEGHYIDARIDTAQPERHPTPKPDLRQMRQPLGVIAVYAVSNFPLAYSTAGGDSVSALAAGCPIIVKGHPSHPGTGELVAQALHKAVKQHQLPDSLVSFVLGSNEQVSGPLVQQPDVKAVGFTGSLGGGMALSKLAAERPDPIPVFAEMGSVNPIFLLPEQLRQHPQTIAENFVQSLTLGTGQYCVNPGLIIALEGPELDQFVSNVKQQLHDIEAGIMLNKQIGDSYRQGLTDRQQHPAVTEVAAGQPVSASSGFYGQAMLLSCNADDFIHDEHLQEELFGPASLLIRCRDFEQLYAVASALKGQLSAAVHGTDQELEAQHWLLDTLMLKAGRVVINGFTTGVEVCPSMVHGGPFPATTDMRFSAVGTASIQRFLRPVCYQNWPQHTLPVPLRDDNPFNLWRVVNGKRTQQSV